MGVRRILRRRRRDDRTGFGRGSRHAMGSSSPHPGTWLALLLILLNVSHYVSLAAEKNKQWLHIAIRVAGSWILAISLLVLAFSLRKHG